MKKIFKSFIVSLALASNFAFAGLVTFPGPGRLLNIQTFTTHGTYTYTPTPGTGYAYVRGCGGGGSGGGVPAVTSGQDAAGGGGGAGGYFEYFDSNPTQHTIVVGQGGPATLNSTVNGGQTYYISGTVFGNGGTGGTVGAGVSSLTITAQVSGGTASGGIINVTGASGGQGIAGVSPFTGGVGGASPFGGMAISYSGSTTNGQSATSPCGGGAGAISTSTGSNFAGGTGGDGLLEIFEFSK